MLHAEMLTGETIPLKDYFSPSQYWFRLNWREPILKDPMLGFRTGDMLLLETDRRRFHAGEDRWQNLCACGFPEGIIRRSDWDWFHTGTTTRSIFVWTRSTA